MFLRPLLRRIPPQGEPGTARGAPRGSPERAPGMPERAPGNPREATGRGFGRLPEEPGRPRRLRKEPGRPRETPGRPGELREAPGSLPRGSGMALGWLSETIPQTPQTPGWTRMIILNHPAQAQACPRVPWTSESTPRASPYPLTRAKKPPFEDLRTPTLSSKSSRPGSPVAPSKDFC